MEPCGNGVYLLSHWLNFLIRVLAQLQRDYYGNCNGNEDIVSCEWTKEIFMNSSDPDSIKRVLEKYEKLDGIQKGGD